MQPVGAVPGPSSEPAPRAQGRWLTPLVAPRSFLLLTQSSKKAQSRAAAALEKRNISCDDIQLVQNLVERCLQLYMNVGEVTHALHHQAKVDPSFTRLVWQKLEEQNPDFFKAYHTRLRVKDQIILFNHLLEQQGQLMRNLGWGWGGPRSGLGGGMHSSGMMGGGGGGGGMMGPPMMGGGAWSGGMQAPTWQGQPGGGMPGAQGPQAGAMGYAPGAGGAAVAPGFDAVMGHTAGGVPGVQSPGFGFGLDPGGLVEPPGGGAGLHNIPRVFSLSDLSNDLTNHIGVDGEDTSLLLQGLSASPSTENLLALSRDAGSILHDV